MICIATLGLTACGKSSGAMYLARRLRCTFISPVAAKRAIAGGIGAVDGLDEHLRDVAYQTSVNISLEAFKCGSPVVVDASFSKASRRKLLYDAYFGFAEAVLFIHFFCNDLQKIHRRLGQRKVKVKTDYDHADSIEVYEFIRRGFEPISEEEVIEGLPVVILPIDTARNAVGIPQFHGYLSLEAIEEVERVQRIFEQYTALLSASQVLGNVGGPTKPQFVH